MQDETQFFTAFSDVCLSIIVPVFNEGEKLEQNLKILSAEVEKYFKDYEIILVNDGSTDKTKEILTHLQISHMTIINHQFNMGKGEALKTGMKFAAGEFILFIDGGMEIHPREIKVFLGLMHLYDADIVIGSKRHPQSVVYYPVYRRILSFLFQQLIRVFFQFNVMDTQVGLKMFKSDVIKSFVHEIKSKSYAVDVEILGLAVKKGFLNILEAPVRLDYFSSKTRNIIPDFFHTLRVGTILLYETIVVWLRLRGR